MGGDVVNRHLNTRTVIRLIAVLAFAVSLTIAWSPWAQAVGNVQVTMENGDLIIQGDNADNNIIITESGVAGRASTLVNNQRRISIPDGVADDVVIMMMDGDDFVRVELPGSNFAVPDDLRITMGAGSDTIELLQTKAPDETRVSTAGGSDVVFIDGVFDGNNFVRPDFGGTFTLASGGGDDLLEFHHAVFQGDVDVSLGSGIDGACSTEDSEFQDPGQARFNGGDPSGFPGDGFVSRGLEFTNIVGFEDFPDDCSFLGGRF